MNDCCIVIPVYKEKLDCVEEISLKRLYKIIYDPPFNMDEYRYWEERDVFLVYPKGMNISEYKKIYPSIQSREFDPKYFKSTATYSQLCISYDFYRRFDCYKYMLIYQLDCYLFKDEISKWCDKGYDYIGGPILSTDCGWDTVKESRKGKTWQPYVGNGGLSLRKISTFKEITDPNGELRKKYELTDEKLANVKFEDKYFCNDLYQLYDLEVPDWKEALEFALDMSVDVVYDIFKWQGQPMGIHSVDKNIRWWKKVIPEFKDQKVIDYCEEKNKEFFKLYYDENDSTYRTK
jgi:hypothetical protein